MKEGWETKFLGDLCTFENGDRGENYPSRSVQTTEGIPFINAGHLGEDGIEMSEMNYIPRSRFDLLSNGKVHRGDILFCLRGSLGKFARVNDLHEGAIASSLVIIRPNNKVLNDFILQYLRSPICLEMVSRFRNGAAQPNLSAASLRKFEVPVPPLSEQRRIVGILDEAFEGIATAKANSEKNLRNAKELFESYLEGVFSRQGEGWVENRLGDIVELIDSLHKTPAYVENGFPMVRVTDIKPGVLDLSKARKVDEDTFREFSRKHTPSPGDIVFSRVGTYGVSSLVDSNEPFCLGQNTVFIVPKINSLLLYHFLNSPNAKQQIDSFVDGTTQPTISMKNIREIMVGIPPQSDQERLVSVLDSVTFETGRLKGIYQSKLAALDDLKKSLLHKAFSGQL